MSNGDVPSHDSIQRNARRRKSRRVAAPTTAFPAPPHHDPVLVVDLADELDVVEDVVDAVHPVGHLDDGPGHPRHVPLQGVVCAGGTTIRTEGEEEMEKKKKYVEISPVPIKIFSFFSSPLPRPSSSSPSR